MTFMTASPKAKVLNVLFVLFNFLAWVCCCVSFGGALQVLEIGGDGDSKMKFKVYWNYILGEDSGSEKIYFDSDSCFDANACSKCKGGGRGLIALQVFAFIGLMAVLALSVIRMVGVSISAFEPTRKALFFELAITAVNVFWFFLAVCVYGGTCFHALGKIDQASTKGTGFAYLIVCFFFLIFNLVLIYTIRGDSSTHMGSSAGSDYMAESDASTTNYNPPQGYQYNGAVDPAAAAAYAGAYNNAQPEAAVASDNNL